MRILDTKKIEYRQLDLAGDDAEAKELKEKVRELGKPTTPPLLFLGGEYLGVSHSKNISLERYENRELMFRSV